MFSILTIVRVIINILFAYGNLRVTNFINHIEKQKDCPCSSGWKIMNGKFISSLLFIVGIVNIFFSANNILSNVPIIGSSYVLIFVLLFFIELFIMSRLAKNLREKECRSCDIKGYESLCKFFRKRTVTECIYLSIIISIIFFYL
jgi:hypothetical protein